MKLVMVLRVQRRDLACTMKDRTGGFALIVRTEDFEVVGGNAPFWDLWRLLNECVREIFTVKSGKRRVPTVKVVYFASASLKWLLGF